MNEPIGLIAGESQLPLLAIRAAGRQHIATVVAGIRGATQPQVAAAAGVYQEFALGQLGALLRFFRQNGVRQAIMLGRVGHPTIFSLLKMDRKFLRLLRSLHDRTTTALLAAVADFFHGEGIEIIDSTFFLPDLLVREKNYTPGRRCPERLRQDIAFGWEKAWGIARLDIGQTVCVKERAVIAVEAMEGTDQTILRAGEIAGRGMTVVKISRPGGDTRFDVPVIGPETIAILRQVQAAALILEAEKTLMLDPEKTANAAGKAGIMLVGKK